MATDTITNPALGATATAPRLLDQGDLPRRPVFPNDVVNRKARPDLSHLPKRVVTVDMDGTMYDAWACCGIRGNYTSSATCDHIRQDTWDAIKEACERYDAVPVVLSWRAGLVGTTKAWLAKIGFEAHAYFIPGSDDDVAGVGGTVDMFQRRKPRWGGSQAVFKAATVANLGVYYGIEVVASFDDNETVISALRELGVRDARVVPRIVEIADHEWTAGYLGAPKPTYRWDSKSTAKPASGWQSPSLFGRDGDWDPYNSAPTTSPATRRRSVFDDADDAASDGLLAYRPNLPTNAAIAHRAGLTIGQTVRWRESAGDEPRFGRIDQASGTTLVINVTNTTHRGVTYRTGKFATVEIARVEVERDGEWHPIAAVCPPEALDDLIAPFDADLDDLAGIDVPFDEGDYVRSLDGEWGGEAEVDFIDPIDGTVVVVTAAGRQITVGIEDVLFFQNGTWVSAVDATEPF